MTEKQIMAAFQAYDKAFGQLHLTMVGMSARQREAAAKACKTAVTRGSALTRAEMAALEPERDENRLF